MARKLISFLLLCSCSLSFCLELKQVLILSRHNLRTPIAERLVTMSPKTWMKWDQAPGELTKKGAMLEGYFGNYFAEWLRNYGLFTKCFDKDSIHVYANTKQRTKDTAEAFVGAAFRNCNVTVISKNTTAMDPIFHSTIRNSSETFREQVYSEMNRKINETDLTNVFIELNRILDIKDSQICKEKKFCDLVNDKDSIVYKVGNEPDLEGPISIGNSVVDAFLMGYYEGFDLQDIAWGEISSVEQLNSLTEVLRDYQRIRFNLPKSSKHYAKPLVEYIKDMLSSNKTFSLLVGHDSNLNAVITALGFKSFSLPGRYEISPIGAKLVFQKWSDGENDLLKVEYVYESQSQIINSERLSLSNPPENITMFFNGLTDRNGFYSWSDFETILQDATK